jgi:hypothetical protein
MAALGLAAVLVVCFLLGLIVAVQAQRRGYNLGVWLLGGTLSGNPVLVLVLLAVMPDFARKRLRRTYMAQLEDRLAAASRRVLGRARAPQPAVAPDRSVGDLPTYLPPSRSVGDEETRLGGEA